MINNNINNKDFLEILDNRILVCDGAMGTMLQAIGVSACPDSLNIKEDDIKKIINIHLDYLGAGSDIIQTNTFGSNPIKLETYGLQSEIKKINKNAINAANEAINIYKAKPGNNRPLFIAGNIGPLGKLLEPAGALKYEEALDAFSRQAEILLENGVNFILIETIMDLNEALAAIEATRKISSAVPIASTLSFGENGITIMGNRAEDAGIKLINAGSDIIGANCSIGSDSMLNVVKKMREANPTARLIVQPNAGLPVIIDGKTTYNETPEIMAFNIEKFLPYKPSVIGACCGSTPQHIKEIVKLIRGI